MLCIRLHTMSLFPMIFVFIDIQSNLADLLPQCGGPPAVFLIKYHACALFTHGLCMVSTRSHTQIHTIARTEHTTYTASHNDFIRTHNTHTSRTHVVHTSVHSKHAFAHVCAWLCTQMQAYAHAVFHLHTLCLCLCSHWNRSAVQNYCREKDAFSLGPRNGRGLHTPRNRSKTTHTQCISVRFAVKWITVEV